MSSILRIFVPMVLGVSFLNANSVVATETEKTSPTLRQSSSSKARVKRLPEPFYLDLINQRRYDEALAAAEKRCRDYPEYGCLLVQRAQCKYHLKKYDSAVDDLDHAIIAKKPDRSNSYKWRYACNIELGKFDKAFLDCEKYLDSNPLDERAQKDIYALARRLPRDKHAQHIASTLTEKYPEIVVRPLVAEGKYAQAEPIITRALKATLTKERKKFFLDRREMCYAALAKYKSALADMNELISLHTSYVPYQLYLRRSEVESSLNMHREAAADLTMVLKKQKHFFSHRVTTDDVYYQRASAYLKCKDYRKAIADYSQILKMDGTQEQAYKQRGDCYAALKEYDKALSDFTNAIKNDNESAGSSYFSRSLVYEKIGKLTEAAADKKKATELGYVAKK